MINMKPVVYAALSTDATILTLVPVDRVYHAWPSQFEKLPSISYREVNKRGALYIDDNEAAREYDYIIDIWGKQSLSSIESAVEAAMKGIGFTLSPGSGDLYEEKTKIYHTPMSFTTKKFS